MLTMPGKLIRNSTVITLVLLSILSLYPLITAFRYPGDLNDDSFITLTFSRNLYQGNGFVFNHPPPVLGTTTPLFTLLVAATATPFSQPNFPGIAVFISAISWMGIPWLFFFFRRAWRLKNWHVILLAMVIIFSGWYGFLGMEAYPFTFLLIFSLSLFLSGHFFTSGLMTGLLFLTRGEGVLVLPLLILALWIQVWVQKKVFDIQALRETGWLILGFLIPVSAWYIYAQFTFGSIFPNTLAAKQAQGRNGLIRPFISRLLSEWLPAWGNSLQPGNLPFLNLWWILTVLGFIDVLLHKRRWLLLAGWLFLYIAGYTLLQVSAYNWYQLPIVFVLSIFFSLGLITVVEGFLRYLKPPILANIISVSFVCLVVFILVRQNLFAGWNYTGDPRGESYRQLSHWFRQHSDPEQSIAFIEIGYLGFMTENRIIDLAGLVQPDIVPHVAEGDFTWGFWQNQPDFYVYLPDFDWALAEIRLNPRFEKEYRAVAQLPGPRQTDFTIYQRLKAEP